MFYMHSYLISRTTLKEVDDIIMLKSDQTYMQQVILATEPMCLDYFTIFFFIMASK